MTPPAPSARRVARNRLIRRSKLAYFAGGVEQISAQFEAGELQISPAQVVVIRERDRTAVRYYAITRDRLIQAIARGRNRRTGRLATRLRAELELSQARPLRVVRRFEGAPERAVVVRDGEVDGVLLPKIERTSSELEWPATTWAPRTGGAAGHGAGRAFEDFAPPAYGGGGFEVPSPRRAPRTRSPSRTRAPGPPVAVPTVRRTPHLDGPPSIPRKAGARFEVSVRLDTSSFRSGESGRPVSVEFPPDVKSVELGVVLTATAHFAVLDGPVQSMTIDRDRERSDPLSFGLEVVDARVRGNAGVTAQFLYRGRTCGRVDRAWSWQAGAKQARRTKGTGRPEDGTATYVRSRRPDLTVLVTKPGKTAPGGGISDQYQASVLTRRIKG